MTRYVYFTATTFDGFIADEHDSLAWLFAQEEEHPGRVYQEFVHTVGAALCGATTYAWVCAELARTGDPWPYSFPLFVFTHRTFEPLHPGVRFVSGSPGEHRAALEEAAEGRDVWVVGGGDLAGQCADDGMLDQVQLSIAAHVLGAGRPLFTRRRRLDLVEVDRDGDFVVATYDVRSDDPTVQTASAEASTLRP